MGSTQQQAFDYIDTGSGLAANLGVNPSLTITALSEYIMSQIPMKE